MDKIILHDMKFYAYHGVFDYEQEQGQYFHIDVELKADLAQACSTDDLNAGIDYSAVYESVRKVTQNNKFRLIERLAEEISQEILSIYAKVYEVTVSVRKPHAPINGEFGYMGVEITRTRNEA